MELKPEQDKSGPPNPFEDIRLWAVLLLLPFIVFGVGMAFQKTQRPAPPQQPRQEAVSTRGEAPKNPFVVEADKAAACDFSQWVGKELYMPAVQKLARPYTFYRKGTEIAPTGDPQAINIELDGRIVTRVWCG